MSGTRSQSTQVRSGSVHAPAPRSGGALFPVFFLLAWIAAGALLWQPAAWLYAFTGAAVIGGLLAGRQRPACWRIALIFALAIPAWKGAQSGRSWIAARNDAETIRALVTAEERILALTPELKDLSKGLFNLQFPDAGHRDAFAPTVSVKEAADGEMTSVSRGDLDLWRPLLDQVDWFEHAKLYFVDGEFLDESFTVFEGRVGFEALARMKSGEWQALKSKSRVVWKREREDGPEPGIGEAGPAAGAESSDRWRITDWETKESASQARPELLFAESLDEAVPSSRDREKLRRSEHYLASIRHYQEATQWMPHPYFAPISANQKPGVSVADIDDDGHDDIYVTVRIGQNLLLRNRGDGTFVEEAGFHGLDIPGHSTCALFADFDNDGDPDLMLGRSLAPSQILINEGGWYRKDDRSGELPRAVISIAAADVNGDGLLDAYLSTYRPAVIGGSSPAGGVKGHSDDWPDHFLDPDEAAEYYRRHKEMEARNRGTHRALLDQLGPSNVLLVNRGGGRFTRAGREAGLDVWRNTLQATFSDFDEDGDPDLYVANDWAPDYLFRNDGDGTFTDATKELGTTAFGFAMGASFGDYDNDGRQDLYVSNMFSKAGRRIIARLEGIHREYAESAAGNYLYRQRENQTFDLVSSLEPPGIPVANGGWSWGGQFADFDNDGFLDIYTLSGYFSAPREVASEVDL